MMPTTIRHKILLVTLLCALVILGGFTRVFLITRQQQELVQKHLELPLVSESWFQLNNSLHRSLRLQLEGLPGQSSKVNAWELPWRQEIEPAMMELETLYKKERLWENERQVEARTFYDIRLMLRQLKKLQQKASKQPPASAAIKGQVPVFPLPLWNAELIPLFQEINGSIEQIISWQTNFSHQQNQHLRTRLLELTFEIWIIALVVLLLLVLLAWILTRQITLPLKLLRDTVRGVKEDRFHGEIPVMSPDEVGELAQEFREMLGAICERTEELEESNRLITEASHHKGMFLTSMSHELRTPLNAIIGFADTLLDDVDEPLSKYRKDRLSRILQSGHQLLQLINSLLDLSRLEMGQLIVSNSKLRLDELILEVIEMLEPLIQKKSLESIHFFHADPAWQIGKDKAPEENSPNPFQLVSDAAKLRQVLINLIGNAIKYTDEGGCIRIALQRTRDNFRVDIEDNGCGIPEELQGAIFQVFEQADSESKRSRGGSGLGLALVHSLLELLGGSVSVKSSLGEGSIFTFSLPLQPPDSTKETSPAQNP